jgi:uracil-DNA glycosylase family 4
MKRVIILEGPDNIGKSYLATALTNELIDAGYKHTKLRHFGPPAKKGQEILQEQLDVLSHEANEMHRHERIEIWDRSVIGEAVYGPLYRAGAYDEKVYWDELVDFCRAFQRSIMVVALYTNLAWYKKMQVRPKNDELKEYQGMEAAENISTAFVNVVTKLPLKQRLLVNCKNYETMDIRNSYITARVRSWLKRIAYAHGQTNNYRHTFLNAQQAIWEGKKGFKKESQIRYQCQSFENKTCPIGNDHREFAVFGKEYKRPTNGCGSIIRVKYIFVGEAPGGNGCGKLGLPFYDDVSGNLMQTALDALGILATEYYMTNVVKCTPKDNQLGAYGVVAPLITLHCVRQLEGEIRRVQYANRKAKVVALGKVAAEQLAKLKIDHVMIYHPAYYLRMGIREQFISELKKVLEG